MMCLKPVEPQLSSKVGRAVTARLKDPGKDTEDVSA